jgi:hypothetical protein
LTRCSKVPLHELVARRLLTEVVERLFEVFAEDTLESIGCCHVPSACILPAGRRGVVTVERVVVVLPSALSGNSSSENTSLGTMYAGRAARHSRQMVGTSRGASTRKSTHAAFGGERPSNDLGVLRSRSFEQCTLDLLQLDAIAFDLDMSIRTSAEDDAVLVRI